MKLLQTALLGAVLSAFAPTATVAQTIVPIEPGALISSQFRGNYKLLDALVELIRAYGYRCDSIHHVVHLSGAYGFKMGCNKRRYVYDIEDRGGTWVVTID